MLAQDGKLRIDPETISDIAYRRLKEAILRGEFLPGAPLVERQLEQAMGVSRTPIRAACQRLVADGLVRTTAHRGTVVSSLSLSEARDAYEVRLALEGMAAQLATLRSSELELQELKRDFIDTKPDAETWFSAEQLQKRQSLHLKIAELSRNADLVRQLGYTINRISLWRNSAMQQGVKYRVTHSEHVEIVDLMLQRKAKEARTRMEEHIELSWKNSIKQS